MNTDRDTTATADIPEPICDRVERLANELQEALEEWLGGSFAAVIHPSSHPCSVYFKQTGNTPENRLALAAANYQACAKAIDPTVTQWWSWSPVDEETPLRFGLYGSRPQEAAQ